MKRRNFLKLCGDLAAAVCVAPIALAAPVAKEREHLRQVTRLTPNELSRILRDVQHSTFSTPGRIVERNVVPTITFILR